MEYKILVDQNVPRGMEGIYAAEVVKQAIARQNAETEKREAERQKREQIAATLEQFKQEAVAREEREAADKQKAARERFEAELHEAFIASNPGATDSDWSRNRQAIVDEAMRSRAAGGGPVELEKQRLLASGRYGL